MSSGTGPRVGAHVDQHDPVSAARTLGARAVQIFLGDPQSYKGPVVSYTGGAEALKAAVEAADLALYVHAPYRINVASTNNRVRIPGRKLLQQHVTAAAEVGARGVIVHGGYLGAAEGAAIGFDNWRKCVDGLDLPIPILIENTAGGENSMARYVESIERLWEAIGRASGAENVGFCLDTCHAHAGGNDLATVADRVLAITGRIDLVHTNDSRDDFDSGADRHANIGKGRVDLEALAACLRTAAKAGADFVVETAPEGQPEDIAWIKSKVN
ncbi:MAG: deoxyribonuclease IV [Dermatophilus congolensis]|nr:deoxyribonuclease IV [Dermatophilus congolensis]